MRLLVSHTTIDTTGESLFFRGQDRDYRDPNFGSSVLPSILRDLRKARRSSNELHTRFDHLWKAEELLAEKFRRSQLETDRTFDDYRVVKWAILQHYQVCVSPLLDITSSLRAACSFALENAPETGIVLVFGLPHVNGSISYYVEEELINLKLLSICPPGALRPHFQEGYVVGSLPINAEISFSRRLDFGRRLIAKFELSKKTFWDANFQEIPRAALFPKKDRVYDVSQEIRSEIS